MIIYDSDLDAILDDTHLAIMVRQIAWLCTIEGGLDLEGHHYTWQARADWSAMLRWSVHRISRVLRRGDDRGIIVRRQLIDNRRAYRLDVARLRELYTEARETCPSWLEQIAPEIYDMDEQLDAVPVPASYPQEHMLESAPTLTPERAPTLTPASAQALSPTIQRLHAETTCRGEREVDKLSTESNVRICMSPDCYSAALDLPDEPLAMCVVCWCDRMPSLLHGWQSRRAAIRLYETDPDEMSHKLRVMKQPAESFGRSRRSRYDDMDPEERRIRVEHYARGLSVIRRRRY